MASYGDRFFFNVTQKSLRRSIWRRRTYTKSMITCIVTSYSSVENTLPPYSESEKDASRKLYLLSASLNYSEVEDDLFLWSVGWLAPNYKTWQQRDRPMHELENQQRCRIFRFAAPSIIQVRTRRPALQYAPACLPRPPWLECKYVLRYTYSYLFYLPLCWLCL
jgi:hypothetical protein